MVRSFTFLAVAVFIAGCGGGSGAGGSTTGNTGSQPAFTYSIAPTTVAAGGAVTVTWSNAGPNYPASTPETNFILPYGSFPSISGSLTLHPYTTDTYLVQHTPSGSTSNVTDQTVVVVNPGTETYVIVGKASDSDVLAAMTALQPLSTVPVTVQATVPPAGSASCIVITQTASTSPNDVAILQSTLAQGKGVVLVGVAPRLLATGDPGNPDTSAIAGWFGASSVSNSSGGTPIVGGGYVPVPVTITAGVPPNLSDPNANTPQIGFGSNVSPLWFAGYPSRLNMTADPNPGRSSLTDDGTAAFGFRPPGGGRIYWQTGVGFGVEPKLLAACARWAAIGP